VRSRTSSQLVLNLLFGWWCFPWGLGTPFAVLQNLFALATQAPGALDEVLALSGLNGAELEVDDNGLTVEERRVLWSVLHYTDRLSRAGGGQPLRIAGCHIAVGLFGEIVADWVYDGTSSAQAFEVPVAALDADSRVLLLRVAVDLAKSPGPLSESMSPDLLT